MPAEFKPNPKAEYEVTCKITYVWVVLSEHELQIFTNFDDALEVYNTIEGAELHKRVLQ